MVRVSGHVEYRPGKRGGSWFAKYRIDGRQDMKKLGDAWKGKGRPPEGYLTRRMAEAKLDAFLTDARRGTLPGLVRTGATVGHACDEWLRHAEHERQLKPSTIASYRSSVEAFFRPAFGDTPLEKVTPAMIERWRASLLEGRSPRTVNKLLTELHGVMERARKVYGLRSNPVADVEKLAQRYSGDFAFYSPEEVMALTRAAESDQDGAIFLTAAFSGLRMGELLALRWADVDFAAETIRVRASYSYGHLTPPKGGKVRSVPMVEQVAAVLAKLGQRERFMDADDLVFPGIAGDHLDGSALRRRYKDAIKRAGVTPLRFHDLRHTFGSLAINRASLVQVQHWLGHADIQTTSRYLHHKSRADEAKLLADAFRVAETVSPFVSRNADFGANSENVTSSREAA
jgi:integrase